MTKRENLLSLYRKTGYEYAPHGFGMVPDLQQRFTKWLETSGRSREEIYDFPSESAGGVKRTFTDPTRFNKYHDPENMKNPYFSINGNGVGLLKTPNSMHMAHFINPLRKADSVEQIKEYPLDCYDVENSLEPLKKHVSDIHASGKASCGEMATTIWETAWYIRGMENLMADMLTKKVKTIINTAKSMAKKTKTKTNTVRTWKMLPKLPFLPPVATTL